jgi:hypothetical protein
VPLFEQEMMIVLLLHSERCLTISVLSDYERR